MLVVLEVRPSFNSNEDIKVLYCRKVKMYLVPSFIYDTEVSSTVNDSPGSWTVHRKEEKKKKPNLTNII